MSVDAHLRNSSEDATGRLAERAIADLLDHVATLIGITPNPG